MQIDKILRFKPKLIPTLFTIPALILLLSLSYWQFQRLYWKQGIINEIATKLELPVVELPKQVNLTEMLYRKIKVKGEFIHNQELHMYGGSRQFKGENGYYILTPLRLTDGRTILINRGWVPEKLKNSNSRPETLTKGETEVEGFIMETEKKPLYVHDNQLEKNLWFYLDLKQISDFLHEPIENFYILAQNNPNILPKGKNLEPNIRNHHLAYALTWLFSAIILMVIYIMYHQEKKS